MGKTIPSATGIVSLKQKEYSEFRKALRKEDKEVLDKLFAYAKFHSTAIGCSNQFFPMESIILSMLIEMQKEIDRLKAQIEKNESVSNT